MLVSVVVVVILNDTAGRWRGLNPDAVKPGPPVHDSFHSLNKTFVMVHRDH